MGGYNQTIPIDQVVSSTLADLGLMSDNNYSVLIEKWINEGVRHTGTNQLFVKKPATLTVENNRATLPPGFRRMLGLRFVSVEEVTNADGSTSQRTVCLPMLYLDRDFMTNECGCDTSHSNFFANYVNSFQIVDNEIVFFSPILDGTKVELSYLAIQTDDNCIYLIYSDFERALSAYARMKFLQAFPEVKGQFTPMLLQMASREWVAQKRWLKGLATMDEFTKNKYMIRMLSLAWFTTQPIDDH